MSSDTSSVVLDPSSTSTSPPPREQDEKLINKSLHSSISPTNVVVPSDLGLIFSETVVAKLWRVAVRNLEGNNPPTQYPEYVTMSGPDAGKYTSREADFWTCGFFPGSLYALLERAMKYPRHLSISDSLRPDFQQNLLSLCKTWADPIRPTAIRTDTHDMGFMFQPTFRMDWELTGNRDSLDCVVQAARSLASRYDERVGAIRSWDQALNYRYSYTDMESDYLVIIDSMCNLDLLYYAGHQTGDQKLIDIATRHAHSILKSLVRDNWSTMHLCVFDTQTGEIKEQLTNQGYADWSTWSRGQSWAILGFTQTYTWTREKCFLEAAVSLSNYFLSQLELAERQKTHDYPYVPLWDFDAPPTPTPTSGVLRDTSAGMIAANGLLLLAQTLIAESSLEAGAKYLQAALRICKETTVLSFAKDTASFAKDLTGGAFPTVAEGGSDSFDAILMHATVNNHEYSHRRYADHGLVYADYYLLEFGNKLMRMGLV